MLNHKSIEDLLQTYIVPAIEHVVDQLVEHMRALERHVRKTRVRNIKLKRVWIVVGRVMVKRVTKVCMRCRRRVSSLGGHLISRLTKCGATPGWWAFTENIINHSSLLCVRLGKDTARRYPCPVTRMKPRAVRLKVARQIRVDSFLQAPHRFQNQVSRGFGDTYSNGSNLVRASRELLRA